MSEIGSKTEIPPVSADDEKMTRDSIPAWHKELLTYLPLLPPELDVVISNVDIIAEIGVGGSAQTASKIELDIDSSFKDKVVLLNNLKATYFHEGFHIAQDFQYESLKPNTAISNAICEGAAVRFELDVTGPKNSSGSYSEIPDIKQWALDIGEIDTDEFAKNWRNYKIYDQKTDRRRWFYRAGTYIVDQYMLHNPTISWAELAITDPYEIWNSFNKREIN